MPAAVMAAAFEHVQKSEQIGVRISVRIDQRMPHAGLRREVHDIVEPVRGEQVRHAGAVRHVHLLELKVGGRGQIAGAAPPSAADRSRC